MSVHQPADPSLMNYMTQPCPRCGLTSVIQVDPRDLERWIIGGLLIQEVWPRRSADWREQLKTGFHPECWRAWFGRRKP